ncbi:hypothetical protein ABZP36_033985 [Zizania latifolia]
MFDLCLSALAIHGHLIVIGMTSQVRFFLIQYARLWQDHLLKLFLPLCLWKAKGMVHNICLLFNTLCGNQTVVPVLDISCWACTWYWQGRNLTKLRKVQSHELFLY